MKPSTPSLVESPLWKEDLDKRLVSALSCLCVGSSRVNNVEKQAGEKISNAIRDGTGWYSLKLEKSQTFREGRVRVLKSRAPVHSDSTVFELLSS